MADQLSNLSSLLAWGGALSLFAGALFFTILSPAVPVHMQLTALLVGVVSVVASPVVNNLSINAWIDEHVTADNREYVSGYVSCTRQLFFGPTALECKQQSLRAARENDGESGAEAVDEAITAFRRR